MVLPSTLLPVDELHVECMHVAGQRVILTATSTRPTAVCPRCHTTTARIHSRYTRTIADVPCVGRILMVSLRVRRFFCDAPLCPKHTFAERFGPELPAYARRTAGLTDALRTIAFATSGQGGARLAHALAMPVSPCTLLRLMHAQPDPDLHQPRVVGVDDWAWKKGASYGTLCVDLERHQPIALLPDRLPETVTG